MFRYAQLILAIAIIIVGSRAASAASIVFSNFGPGDSFNNSVAWDTAGASSVFEQHENVAMAFTPSNSYTLDSIKLAIVGLIVESPDDLVDVKLLTDPTNPEDFLESWSFNDLPPNGSMTTTSALSILHPVLTANTQYWLLFDVHDPNTPNVFFWNVASFELFGPGPTFSTVSFPNGSYPNGVFQTAQQGAFEVTGTLVPVPEPATLTLVGSLFVGLTGILCAGECGIEAERNASLYALGTLNGRNV